MPRLGVVCMLSASSFLTGRTFTSMFLSLFVGGCSTLSTSLLLFGAWKGLLAFQARATSFGMGRGASSAMDSLLRVCNWKWRWCLCSSKAMFATSLRRDSKLAREVPEPPLAQLTLYYKKSLYYQSNSSSKLCRKNMA